VEERKSLPRLRKPWEKKKGQLRKGEDQSFWDRPRKKEEGESSIAGDKGDNGTTGSSAGKPRRGKAETRDWIGRKKAS